MFKKKQERSVARIVQSGDSKEATTNKFFETVRWAAIGVVLTLCVSHQSFAGIIDGPFWMDDSSTSASVAFISSDVVNDEVHHLGSFTSPNNFWEITSLDITEFDMSGSDMVSIIGEVQHLPSGPTLSFDFSFDVFTPGITTGVILATDMQTYGVGFSDELLVQVQATISGFEIIGYGIGIGAGHVPEPVTIALLGLGGLALRRRRRAC